MKKIRGGYELNGYRFLRKFNNVRNLNDAGYFQFQYKTKKLLIFPWWCDMKARMDASFFEYDMGLARAKKRLIKMSEI